MTDNSKRSRNSEAPDTVSAPDVPQSGIAATPSTAHCKRCALDVQPTEKYRCPRCNSFLPGNPGNPTPKRDEFSDLETQLLEEAGPDVSVTDRVRISAYVAAHRVLQQAIDAARRANDPREALALLKLLGELPAQPTFGPAHRPVAKLSTRQLYEELVALVDQTHAHLTRNASPTPDYFGPAPAPEIADDPSEPGQQVSGEKPDDGPESASGPTALPPSDSPVSGPPTGEVSPVRTIGDLAPEELDDATRIALYGESAEDIARRKQREADDRERRTTEMLNNIGRTPPWL